MNENRWTGNAWRVEIDTEICSLCEMCVSRCSNHALIARRDGSTVEILFDYRLCDACLGQTFCQEHCPENAVTVTRLPAKELPDEPIRLIADRLATCRQCGSFFMPERKLATLLHQKKITPKEAQKYCPACRRENLLDGYLKMTGRM